MLTFRVMLRAADLELSPVGLASGAGGEGRGLSSIQTGLRSLSACRASDDL